MELFWGAIRIYCMATFNGDKDDVLDALLTDLVADQVIRALYFGYRRKDIEEAVARGLSHGICEFKESSNPSPSRLGVTRQASPPKQRPLAREVARTR